MVLVSMVLQVVMVIILLVFLIIIVFLIITVVLTAVEEILCGGIDDGYKNGNWSTEWYK